MKRKRRMAFWGWTHQGDGDLRWESREGSPSWGHRTRSREPGAHLGRIVKPANVATVSKRDGVGLAMARRDSDGGGEKRKARTSARLVNSPRKGARESEVGDER